MRRMFKNLEKKRAWKELRRLAMEEGFRCVKEERDRLYYENMAMKMAWSMYLDSDLEEWEFFEYADWLKERFLESKSLDVDSSLEAFWHWQEKEREEFDETMELDPNFNLD